ncbi:MAG: hypothetical protein R2822_22020 [Spirosomataceae bacterium]
MPRRKLQYPLTASEKASKKAPNKIQIADSDFKFACELLIRMGVDFAVIPVSENDQDYLGPRRTNFGLS